MKNQNLAVLFKYYNEGKITDFTLCSEIEDYMSTTLRTQVELINGGGNILVAMLPVKTATGYKVRYLIEKGALSSSYVSHEDIVECLDFLKEKEQEILMAFHKELQVMKTNEVGLMEVLASYLKIYRMTRSVLPVSVKSKLQASNTDALDEYIEKLETYSDRVDHIIEDMSMKGIVPLQFIEEAKNLVGHQVETRIVVGDLGLPHVNVLNGLLGHTAEMDDVFSGGIKLPEPTQKCQ